MANMNRFRRSASDGRNPTASSSSSAAAHPTFTDPALSGLQQFILDNQLPRDSPHPPYAHLLALNIAHNLRFEHDWTDLRIHYQLLAGSASAHILPRPMISGLPPNRLYVHPDEQIEILQKQRQQGKAGWPQLDREREWVLPSQLTEIWSLRRFAEVFDALSQIPPEREGGPLFFVTEYATGGRRGPRGGGDDDATPSDTSAVSSGIATPANAQSGNLSLSDQEGNSGEAPNRWRVEQPKRMLLATQGNDSTVVYYIVHDGIVKPRQNG